VTAVARRDQLLDGRIDRGVFSADAASGQESNQEEGKGVPRQPSEGRRGEGIGNGAAISPLVSKKSVVSLFRTFQCRPWLTQLFFRPSRTGSGTSMNRGRPRAACCR
jgi:hypothetical protein